MIEFKSVSYTHPNGVKALQDVNLTIEEGELIAIVGENGAGKTTLVKHANGLLKPTLGTVLVFGMDTKHASVAQLSRKVGIIFQNADHQLFSDSAENEIAFGLRNFGFEPEVVGRRTDWALNFFGLEQYRKTSPMMLSGGEKKRLCLAAILAWDPDVAVMDEPTVGQDAIQKERLVQIVKMLLSQRKTVIIVSHDIEFLWPMQPRVVVMAKGRILLDAAAAKVFCDEKILKEANLLSPQLVEFSKRLFKKPEAPFPDAYDARRWLLSRIASEGS